MCSWEPCKLEALNHTDHFAEGQKLEVCGLISNELEVTFPSLWLVVLYMCIQMLRCSVSHFGSIEPRSIFALWNCCSCPPQGSWWHRQDLGSLGLNTSELAGHIT